MHKGIHTPTMQSHVKMKSGKGQSSMRKQHSSRKMVHSSAKMAGKNSKMKGGY